MRNDSADRAGREAAVYWGFAAWAHKARGAATGCVWIVAGHRIARDPKRAWAPLRRGAEPLPERPQGGVDNPDRDESH
jgi:hypothetical protein